MMWNLIFYALVFVLMALLITGAGTGLYAICFLIMSLIAG